MNKGIKLAVIAVFVLLVGCKEKGHDFVGHWTNIKEPTTSYLDISYSDSVYHVNVSSLDRYLTMKVQVNRLEAQAMSESVLTIHTGLGNVDMRLENNHIFFEHDVYQKTE